MHTDRHKQTKTSSRKEEGVDKVDTTSIDWYSISKGANNRELLLKKAYKPISVVYLYENVILHLVNGKLLAPFLFIYVSKLHTCSFIHMYSSEEKRGKNAILNLKMKWCLLHTHFFLYIGSGRRIKSFRSFSKKPTSLQAEWVKFKSHEIPTVRQFMLIFMLRYVYIHIYTNVNSTRQTRLLWRRLLCPCEM